MKNVSNSLVLISIEVQLKEKEYTLKFEFLYFALLSNFSIFSGESSLIACFSINHGEISALTSSGIFESRLVCWFIITHVLFHIFNYLAIGIKYMINEKNVKT